MPNNQEIKEEYKEIYDFIFKMMGFIAKSKGHVEKDDIKKAEVIMLKIRLNDYEKTCAKKAFNLGKDLSFNYIDTINTAKAKHLIYDIDLYQIFSIFSYMAFNNGIIDSHYHNLLTIIANKLNVKQDTIDKVYANIRMNDISNIKGCFQSAIKDSNKSSDTFNLKKNDFIFKMLGFLAKSKGHVSKDDIEKAKTFMLRLNCTKQEQEYAKKAFNLGKDLSFNYRDAIANAYTNNILGLKNNPTIFRIFALMVLDNGSIDEHYQDLLFKIADELHLNYDVVDEILLDVQDKDMRSTYKQNRHNKSSYQKEEHSSFKDNTNKESSSLYKKYCESCFLLDVFPDSDFEEIKRAYKKAIFKYHPDKIKAYDVPNETKKLYEKRAKEIQDAFNIVKIYLNKD